MSRIGSYKLQAIHGKPLNMAFGFLRCFYANERRFFEIIVKEILALTKIFPHSK